jgi:DNA-directed RNA polymerase alpha subunit
MSSNRLERLQDFFGVTSRKTRLKPTIWVKARMGYADAIQYVADHCKADVKVLEDVHKKLEPVERKTYIGI